MVAKGGDRRVGAPAIDVVGREGELRTLSDFLAGAAAGPGALVLEGEAGIGKTSLWWRGVDQACDAGLAVLSTRPTGSEAGFAFAALADLLEEHLDALEELPAPQRSALRVALALDDATAGPADERVVARALLGALRVLARSGPVLVAVDDAQWLDPGSAAALGFAARRLRTEPVRFLVARRAGMEAPLALPEPLELVSVGPLSLGALQRLLQARTGASLPRRTLQRLVEVSGGNPFYALELARAVSGLGGRLGFGGEVPVPTDLGQLLRARLEALPAATRDVLAAAALVAEPSLELLVELVGEEAWTHLEPAVAARIVELEGTRVRFTHPLLAAAAASAGDPRRRRELHRLLAELVPDPEARARHLALGSERPNELVATALSRAAERARSRGASHAAVELAREAWLFSVDEARRVERLFTLTECELRVVASGESAARLRAELARLPPGADRARAYYLLARCLRQPPPEGGLERALEDAGDDPALRANILLASRHATDLRTPVDESTRALREALALARAAGDEQLEARCRGDLAWTDAAAGRDVERSAGDVVALGAALFDDTERVRAVQKIWRGEMDEAREILLSLRGRADELEEEWSQFVFALHMFELESRRGDWHAAAEHHAELATLAVGSDTVWEPVRRCEALLHAIRGDREAATAAVAAAAGGPSANRWQTLEATRALGIAALACGDAAAAALHLGDVAAEIEQLGFRDPGAFPVAPDLIDALAVLDRRDDAERELERLESVARELAHPWAAVVSARCRGLLYEDEASLQAALALHERLSLPFEHARTLLVLGRLQRRRRQRTKARETLAVAASRFDELGARAWSEQARGELARVPGRASAGDALTPAERRLAEVVASGRTNREAAAELFISVNTVESTLRRVYAKLGVRSRAELARRFPA